MPDFLPVPARLLVVALALAAIGVAQQDPVEIMRRSVKADNRNEALRLSYTWKVLTVIHEDAGKGKATHSSLLEMLPIGGQRYAHLLEKDGKPLSPEDARKAQKGLDDAVSARSRLSPEARKAAGAKAEARRAKGREQIQHIPDAFEFRLLGEEIVNGRPAWHIQASPRRDYKGPNAFVYRNMEGTLWVDKQDYQWVKVEADSLDTISFGWFLARVAKGSRISLESARVNDELWAPKSVTLRAAVRVALVKQATADQEQIFSDYRKFRTDSRLLSATEPE